jgi:hypothetical protein
VEAIAAQQREEEGEWLKWVGEEEKEEEEQAWELGLTNNAKDNNPEPWFPTKIAVCSACQ